MLVIFIFWLFVFFGLTRFDFYAFIVPFHSLVGNIFSIVIGCYYILAFSFIMRDILTIKKYYNEMANKIEEEKHKNISSGRMGMSTDRDVEIFMNANSYVREALQRGDTFNSSVGALLKQKFIWVIQTYPFWMYLVTGLLWNFIQ